MDKNIWEESDIKIVWTKTSNLSLRFVWVSIHCELKRVYKRGKVDDIIPNLQLDPKAKKQNKTKIGIEKACFKTGIRLKIRLKNSRNILRVAIN